METAENKACPLWERRREGAVVAGAEGIFSMPGADTDFSGHFPVLRDRRPAGPGAEGPRASDSQGGRDSHFHFVRDCTVSFRARGDSADRLSSSYPEAGAGSYGDFRDRVD